MYAAVRVGMLPAYTLPTAVVPVIMLVAHERTARAPQSGFRAVRRAGMLTFVCFCSLSLTRSAASGECAHGASLLQACAGAAMLYPTNVQLMRPCSEA